MQQVIRRGMEHLGQLQQREGKITVAQKQEILYHVHKGPYDLWKPKLYVIPRDGIDKARLKEVPPKERAGTGMEYIIKDLRKHEFDMIEI